MLEKPICIIGAARSGTTLLLRLLAEHPDTAVWGEPKYLWQYRKPNAFHDKRTADEATLGVQKYIRSQLEEYLRQEGAKRLVEKTPSNCFRVPFVYEVLPDARYVHVVRDGRDVAFSAREQWGLVNEDIGESHEERITHRLFRYAWRRIRSKKDIPAADLPVYAAKFLKKIVKRIVLGGLGSEVNVWGPKFPGIREVAAENETLETCAIQWQESVRAAYEGLRSVPAEQRMEVRFEGLVREPEEHIRAILDFGELKVQDTVVQRAGDIVSEDAAERWRERNADEVGRVMDTVGDFVRKLEGIQSHQPDCAKH